MQHSESPRNDDRNDRRRIFPHQLSWLIDNPMRRLLISPATLADRLQLAETDHVLEIGPGSGYFSAELARRVPAGRLEMLDVQPRMLQKARRKIASEGLDNVSLMCGSADDPLPFPDDHFDAAIMVAVLGEIDDREACLREAARVLRPSGRLAVHEHIPDPDRVRFDDLRRLAEHCGFEFASKFGPPWNYTAVFRTA